MSETEDPRLDGPPFPGLLDAVAPRGRYEDFITNAFCWLLSNVPGLGPAFLNFLRGKEADGVPSPGRHPIPDLDEDSLEWDTQTSFWREGQHPVRPDMTCADGKRGIVFEHKTWTRLHAEQLANYRNHAPSLFRDAPIVLITAHRGQHDQHPDLALCWSEVHACLDDWVAPGDAGYAVREFQTLLARRGLGPMSKLPIEDVRSFRPLERTLHSILGSVAQREWKGDGERKVRSEWGRVGFMVRGQKATGGDAPTWNPGVFVGVMLDGWDHCTKPSHPERGPDACVIVSVRKDVQAKVREPPQSQRLAEKLEEVKKMNASPLHNWQIYRHALHEAVRRERYGLHHGPNPWHPLHIRRPLADLLCDASTGEEQAQRFYEELRKVTDLVLDNLEAPWKPR